MPTFVLFMVNTNDGNTKLFNSGSAVIFKLDTTVGISWIPFKYDKRVLIPWSNSWFPKVCNNSNTKNNINYITIKYYRYVTGSIKINDYWRNYNTILNIALIDLYDIPGQDQSRSTVWSWTISRQSTFVKTYFSRHCSYILYIF